jgi:LytS/YehU family sensor histidine kinase
VKIRWDTNQRTRAMMYLGLNGALYGSLAMFIYVRLRNAGLAARVLADAEIRRSEEQRALIAAQLVAAQSRVDPAFVMKALDDIERDYETDPARADEALDEFIAFLRDAIPRLRADERTEAT